MQRIPFAIAMFAVAITITSFCATPWGNCKQPLAAGNYAEISLNRPFRVPWEDGTTFVMHWNDACKKFLFDGYPICHAKPKVYDGWHGSARVRIIDPVDLVSSAPASEHPDEYSFDVAKHRQPRCLVRPNQTRWPDSLPRPLG